MTLVQEAFEQQALRHPERVALVCGTQRISFRALYQRARALGQALTAQGVRRGDRVLILLDAGVDYAAALHAVWMAGAVIVPLNASTKADKLAFIAADTRATALLTQASLLDSWRAAWQLSGRHLHTCMAVGDWGERTPPQGVLPWPDAEPAAAVPEVRCIDQDIAALIYTSGTTGRPKGVVLSHLNMCSAWASVQAYLGLNDSDVVGLALPPTYSYGLYNLMMGLGHGATVVIERYAAFPAKLAETLARERVTVLPGVPTLFAALLDWEPLDRVDLSSLRLVTNAAAALPQAHLQRLRRRLPAARVVPMYGMTECMRVSYLPQDELDRRPGSVGRGMPNQDHWLIDEQGQVLPHGSTGELVVRGTHVMRGYWERPQETAERLRPGRYPGDFELRTGDIFRTDEDGYLYFVSRRDDIIKTRGEKVSPREVEEVIYALDGVQACAVVGVPDAALGEAVKAFVVLRDGAALTAKDVTRHCLARLENHAAPKFVDFVADLPRTDSGKIRHASLRGTPDSSPPQDA